jgi:hypothetical protein
MILINRLLQLLSDHFQIFFTTKILFILLLMYLRKSDAPEPALLLGESSFKEKFKFAAEMKKDQK